MSSNPGRSPFDAALARAAAECERLDAVERNLRSARAAMVIARYEINRLRVGSLVASRRRVR